MKVKEYLVNRILELERDLKQLRNEKAGTTFGLQKLQEDVIKLNEKIEQYQMEREHIKQIITCNIVPDRFRRASLCIVSENSDFKTLLAILDIKSGDYTDDNDTSNSFGKCSECVHKNLSFAEWPCNSCLANREYFKQEDNNAETKD